MWPGGYPIPSSTSLLLVIVAVALARHLLGYSFDSDGAGESGLHGVDHEPTLIDGGHPESMEDVATQETDKRPWAFLPSGREPWILLLVLAGLIRVPFGATLDWRDRLLGGNLNWSPEAPGPSAWSLLPYLPVLAFFLGLLLVGKLRSSHADVDRRRARPNALLALVLAGFWLPLPGFLLELRDLVAVIMPGSGSHRYQSDIEAQTLAWTQFLLLLFALGIGAWACYRTATWLNHGYKTLFRVGWRRKAGWLLGVGMWAAVAQGVTVLLMPIMSAAVHMVPRVQDVMLQSGADRVSLLDGLWYVWVQLVGLVALIILGALARPILERTLARWAEPLPDPLDVRLIKELAAIGLIAWPVTLLTGVALWLRYGMQ